MKLCECYIENFGKLSGFKYSFKDGLNGIKAENGYGKTTLSVFIKAMFYGLDDTKKIKLEENDRKHYLPWNGGKCGGYLDFVCKSGSYRIERTFMPRASEDTFKLYDTKSGKESFDFTKNIGEELFGIDCDGFERTVFLSEQNLSGKNENKTVSAKLSNLVGYEGDLSVMDDAIELLEKERKIYHKRGGAGEIGEIQAKISELDIKINNLERQKITLLEEEKKLSEIKSRLNNLYGEKESLLKESKLYEEKKARLTYEKQYRDMRLLIEKDEETRDNLKSFFANGIPTQKEIEEAKELHLESKRLLNTVTAPEANDEYAYLFDFFKNAPEDEEFSAAEHLSLVIKEKSREKNTLSREIEQSARMYENEASSDTIDTLISENQKLSNTKTANKSCHITLPLGILFILLGIGLAFVSLPLLLFSGVGIVLLFFAAVNISGLKKAEEAKNARIRVKNTLKNVFHVEVGDSDNLTELLYGIRADIQNAKRERDKISAISEKISLIDAELSELSKKADAFLARFPSASGTAVDAIEDVLKKHDIYKALYKSRSDSIEKTAKLKERAGEYELRANAFAARFPTVTNSPFDEISSRLIEYNSLSLSITRMRETLDAFAKEHGISAENLTDSFDASSLKSFDFEELNVKIAELEREKTLQERACFVLSEECNSIDELKTDKEELSAKIEEYKDRLDIIVKTKKYLNEAKDSLTSKYLSKTKAAFDRYVEIIARESGGDFLMDTSFSIMKNEHGSLKPTAAFSRGTRDIYALATRFALVESIYEDEMPFIILDDPFAYFDDEKLKAAISSLKALAREKQIIYLTCTDSRKI